jgi:ribose transport system substrate-binding protein
MSTSLKRATVLLFVACMGLAACAGDKKEGNTAATGSSGSTKPAKEVDIRVVDLFADPFYLTMNCGAVREAKKLGVKLTISAPEEPTPEKQLPTLRAAIAAKPDALIFAPSDGKALTPTLQRAMKDGIKVILVDQTIDDPTGISAQVSSDQVEVGRLAAKFVADKLGDKGEAVMLGAPRGFPALDHREDGFAEGLKQTGVQLKTVLRDKKFSPDGNAALVKALVAADPAVTGFYSSFAAPAVGASSVARQRGSLDAWTIVTTDQDSTAMGLLQNGGVDAIIGQKPEFVGEQAVLQAYNAVTGKPVQAKVTSPATVITKENAASTRQYLSKAACG